MAHKERKLSMEQEVLQTNFVHSLFCEHINEIGMTVDTDGVCYRAESSNITKFPTELRKALLTLLTLTLLSLDTPHTPLFTLLTSHASHLTFTLTFTWALCEKL